MLTKRLISRLALAATLLAGGVALPSVALAHGNHHDRGRWSHGDRHDHHHHYRHQDRGHHWKHSRHWDDGHRWNHHRRPVRVYERHYVAPSVHYAPVPLPRPGNGVTVIFRNDW